MTWHERAACRGLDTELFFPEGRARFGADYSIARDICDGCEVRAACLDDAVTTRDPHGMRGGLTPDERRPLTRGRRQPTVRVPRRTA